MRDHGKSDTQKIRTGVYLGRLELRNVDLFWGFNILLFLWMSYFTYFERFVEYRGAGNLYEFYVYALLIIIGLGAGWWFFRRFSIPSYILFLVQLGILVHFLGGMAILNGERLYDSYILNIRFDKYVHFLNAFIAALITNFFFDKLNFQIPYFRHLILIMFVLGLGAVIEIIEYIVLLTIPGNGVGGYHNNMQDLVSNLMGCLSFIALLSLSNRLKRSRK